MKVRWAVSVSLGSNRWYSLSTILALSMLGDVADENIRQKFPARSRITMKLQVIGKVWLIAATTILASLSQRQVASGQEILPSPTSLRARSASLANGGIEWEWGYHRYANSPIFQTRFTPIARDGGGVGYCCPTKFAPYYGCDTGRGCSLSNGCR